MTDFSSIDRMMEFGLGLAIARQMADTMNHAMSNMQVPGTGAMPVQQVNTSPRNFYAVIADGVAGPLTETEFVSLVGRGDIDRETLVWRPGNDNWRKVENDPEAYKLLLLNT